MEEQRLVNSATFQVWVFPTPDGARRSSYAVGRSERIEVDDGAIASWPVDDARPEAYQDLDLGVHPFDASFWGLLFSVLFLLPSRSGESADAPGQSEGHDGDTAIAGLGFTSSFCRAVRQEVVPGTSALLLLDATAGASAITRLLPPVAVEIVRFDMSVERLSILRTAFGRRSSSTGPALPRRE